MNINGDRWRAGTGCQWMAFCSASDSNAPLMGSAWLDSIMSPDTLWRGCKLSIRPLSLSLSPPFMLPHLLLLSAPCSLWSFCHHSPCSYFPFFSSCSLSHIKSTSCFCVWSILIYLKDIDMNCIQEEWKKVSREVHEHFSRTNSLTQYTLVDQRKREGD